MQPAKHMRSMLIAAAAFGVAPTGPASAVAAVSGETVARAAPDRLVVTWTDKDPVDVYVAERPDAGLDQAKLVSAADRDGRYEASAPAGRLFFLLKDRGDGKVVRTAERVLPLQQSSNFRDLGGYPAADGKRVRWGRIYRSGGTALLTDADVRAVSELHIGDLVDLRSREERALAPTRIDGVRYHAISYSMSGILARINSGEANSGYGQMAFGLTPQLRMVFKALLEEKGEAVAYNCSAGQDRTGFTTAMVLSALGTPRDVIYRDYLLSTPSRRPQYELPRITPAMAEGNPVAALFARYQDLPAQPLLDAEGRPLLLHVFNTIEQRWGTVDAFLRQEIGLSDADIARLRETYLE